MCLPVELGDDDIVEGDENFPLVIESVSPSPGVVTGPRDSTDVIIQDDDSMFLSTESENCHLCVASTLGSISLQNVSQNFFILRDNHTLCHNMCCINLGLVGCHNFSGTFKSYEKVLEAIVWIMGHKVYRNHWRWQ